MASTADEVDDNGNGLIDIGFIEDLDKIRYDLNGSGMPNPGQTGNIGGEGCPDGGCNGYDLVRDLDFGDDDSYRSGDINTSWCPGDGTGTGNNICTPASPNASSMPGFPPIARNDSAPFTGILDGNLNRISNLYINIDGRIDRNGPTEIPSSWFGPAFSLAEFDARILEVSNIGLFGVIEDATIRRLGLLNVSIFGQEAEFLLPDRRSLSLGFRRLSSAPERIGGLVGRSEDSTILAVGVTGNISFNEVSVDRGVPGNIGAYDVAISTPDNPSGDSVGGMVGSSMRTKIYGSWTNINIFAGDSAGGLIGQVTGGGRGTNVIALSYTRGTIELATRGGGLATAIAGTEFHSLISSWAAIDILQTSQDSVRNNGNLIYGISFGNTTHLTLYGTFWQWFGSNENWRPDRNDGGGPNALNEEGSARPMDAFMAVDGDGGDFTLGSGGSVGTAPSLGGNFRPRSGHGSTAPNEKIHRFGFNCGNAWSFRATGEDARYPRVRELLDTSDFSIFTSYRNGVLGGNNPVTGGCNGGTGLRYGDVLPDQEGANR